MGTKIPWCDTTWNPVTGCTPVSEGCTNCYALRMLGRNLPNHSGPAPTFHPDRLDAPLHWRKPRSVFVCSMGDLFHEAITDEQRDGVFAVMALAPHLTFLALTKRPEQMREYVAGIGHADEMALGDIRWLTGEHRLGEQIGWPGDLLMRMRHLPGRNENWTYRPGEPGAPAALEWSGDAEEPVIPWPLPNLWLGVTVESGAHRDRLIHLRNTPAAVRFVSIEPMLSPLPELVLDGIDWLILGGETGPGARPMRPEWALDVWRQCKAAGVPFFWKQGSKGIEYDAAMTATREYPEAPHD